jgi:hypothetical protein
MHQTADKVQGISAEKLGKIANVSPSKLGEAFMNPQPVRSMTMLF